MRLSKPTVYALCALLMSMLHSVFSSFYVDFFMRRTLPTGSAPVKTVAVEVVT